MKYLQKILVTIDFSESSNYIVENSIKLAEKFNSEITLMHVIGEEHLSEKLDHFIEESVQTELDKIASQITSKGIKLNESVITHGAPFEKIIDEASANDYNVIIAGKSTKTENNSYGNGTTVDKLIRKNEIPVWVVRPQPVGDIKKILCPVDFSDASKRALDNAITLARSYKATLTILNVYKPIHYSSMWYEVDSVNENKALRLNQEAEFKKFLTNFDLTDVSYNAVSLEGEVHSEILKFVKENEIGLLLMGTTGRSGLSRLLMGSTTTKVTREVQCNFITTKTKDITDDYFGSSLKSLEIIINSARKLIEKKDYNGAIEKYTIALKQHPYNIPVFLGLIECYEAIDDKDKVEYYRNNAHIIVERIWGKKYLHIFKL